MNYCYARVSTKDQHLDRQIDAFKNYEPYVLYSDKESGKDFDRTNYKRLKKKVKSGDTVIVLSLDRFGRNYDLIKQEWQYFISKNVKIKVIDMPILNNDNSDLISKLISDIVLQLLSFVAQNERETMRIRQAEGIKTAKARGVKFGRPKINLPDDFEIIAKQYLNNEIKNVEACEILGMSRGTFFRYLKEYKLSKGMQKIKPEKKQKFSTGKVYEMFMNKEIGTLLVSEYLKSELGKWYPKYQKWKKKKLKCQA